MKATAIAHGAASVLNAMANWKGAAFGVDLHTRATVELRSGGITASVPDDATLAVTCVAQVLNHFDADTGAHVATQSNIPIARGMKSSSAAANAIVLATAAALGEKLSDAHAINHAVDACVRAGVTVTGAFDDACASYFGNLQITDNAEREVLKTFELEEGLRVLFLVPEKKAYSGSVNAAALKAVAKDADEVLRLAYEGHYWEAMNLNGRVFARALGVDYAPCKAALAAGAIASSISGKGPAIAAVCEEKRAAAIKRAWKPFKHSIIECGINKELPTEYVEYTSPKEIHAQNRQVRRRPQ
jgi:shikimate kinase